VIGGRPLACPSAAVTTAATTNHPFPVAAAEICNGTHSRCVAQEYQFCAPDQSFRFPAFTLENMSSLITKHFSRGLLTEGSHVRNRSGEPVRFFRTSQVPESAANQLKGCRSNQMHCETKPASAVRLFTSQSTARSAQLPTSCALSPHRARSLRDKLLPPTTCPTLITGLPSRLVAKALAP
jgi:hypothetical protein